MQFTTLSVAVLLAMVQVSTQSPIVKRVAPQCNLSSTGPSTVGWQKTTGFFPAKSWEECHSSCTSNTGNCESFAFSTGVLMRPGEECIHMKASTSAAGIWNDVGSTSDDASFQLYDVTCSAA